MFCPNCGTPAEEGQSSCANCGAALTVQAPQPVVAVPKSSPGKGFGIASMVLGIVSLVLFCVVYVAIPCAIVGIVLGAVSILKAKKVGASCGMGIAGLVCSIIALAILVAIFAFAGSVVGSFFSALA